MNETGRKHAGPGSNTSDGKELPRGRHPLKVFLAGMVLTPVILVGLAWHGWHAYGQFRSDQTRHYRTLELTGVITHLDEVLTMSARMAAATGEPKWERRYRVFEPELGEAIHKAMALWPDLFISEAVSQTNLANMKLVDMENKAFDAVRDDDLDAAAEILYSEAYEKQKQIYSDGMIQVGRAMTERMQVDLSRQKRVAVTTLALMLVLLALTTAIWLYAVYAWRHYSTPLHGGISGHQ